MFVIMDIVIIDIDMDMVSMVNIVNVGVIILLLSMYTNTYHISPLSHSNSNYTSNLPETQYIQFPQLISLIFCQYIVLSISGHIC